MIVSKLKVCGSNEKYMRFLKSHMQEAVMRAKIDGLQHCCEHINNACVGNTASILCAFLEDMYYCIETLCKLDVANSEQSCIFL